MDILATRGGFHQCDGGGMYRPFDGVKLRCIATCTAYASASARQHARGEAGAIPSACVRLRQAGDALQSWGSHGAVRRDLPSDPLPTGNAPAAVANWRPATVYDGCAYGCAVAQP